MSLAAWGQWPVADVGPRVVVGILLAVYVLLVGSVVALLELDRFLTGWRARRRARRRRGMITLAGPLGPRPDDKPPRKRAA